MSIDRDDSVPALASSDELLASVIRSDVRAVIRREVARFLRWAGVVLLVGYGAVGVAAVGMILAGKPGRDLGGVVPVLVFVLLSSAEFVVWGAIEGRERSMLGARAASRHRRAGAPRLSVAQEYYQRTLKSAHMRELLAQSLDGHAG